MGETNTLELNVLGIAREMADVVQGPFGPFDLSYEELGRYVTIFRGTEFVVSSRISSTPGRYDLVIVRRTEAQS
ncbi:MAG: hypothetical protein KJ879_02725 [Nanoarchaeota archaeon]|nr:hypothetical protein [Nanoarchaeota archaeon]